MRVWKASQGSGRPVRVLEGQLVNLEGKLVGLEAQTGGLEGYGDNKMKKRRNEETEAQNCRGTILCICMLTIYASVYK